MRLGTLSLPVSARSSDVDVSCVEALQCVFGVVCSICGVCVCVNGVCVGVVWCGVVCVCVNGVCVWCVVCVVWCVCVCVCACVCGSYI